MCYNNGSYKIMYIAYGGSFYYFFFSHVRMTYQIEN